MHDMNINVPDSEDILSFISDVDAEFGEERRSIDEWRVDYRESLTDALARPDIDIFNGFINSLLERAMSGEAWARRHEAFQESFRSFDDITPARVADVLKRSGYRFPSDGLSVILAAKEIVTSKDFSWRGYVSLAEEAYGSDFAEDVFLDIKGVGLKTRDLALSELSERFIAVDLHVVRVVTRTGLILRGYGDPRITTDVSKDGGYLFFHDLILKLARDTGWPESGYSPGEMDRMLWNFGRAVCGSTPRCSTCPLRGACLTSVGQM